MSMYDEEDFMNYDHLDKEKYFAIVVKFKNSDNHYVYKSKKFYKKDDYLLLKPPGGFTIGKVVDCISSDEYVFKSSIKYCYIEIYPASTLANINGK